MTASASASASTPAPVPPQTGRHPHASNPIVEAAKLKRDTTLNILAVAQLLDFVSMSALNIAVPVISRDMNIPTPQGAWVPLAYALPLSALLLPMGRLGDIFGYRTLFFFGVALMAVSNVVSALAPNILILVLSRAAQGVGAAANMPSSAAIVANLFEPGPTRSKAMGRLGSMSAMGSAIGILLGGMVTQAVGWRAIFWTMLPVCVGLTVASIFLPDLRNSDVEAASLSKFDFSGTVTWLAGVGSIIFVLSTTKGSAWTELSTMVLLIGGFLCLIAFAVIESRTSQKALLASRVLARPVIYINALLTLLVRGGAATFVFLMSLKLQILLGLDALQTALQSLPMSFAGFLFSFFIATLVGKLGTRALMTLGFAVCILSSYSFLQLVVPGSNFWLTTLPTTVIFTVGTPAVFIPAQIDMLHSSEPRDFATVGAIFNTAGQVGGPLAIALQTAVMNAITSRHEHEGTDRQTGLKETFDAANWVTINLEILGFVLALTFWALPRIQAHLAAKQAAAREADPERQPLLE